MLEMLRPRAIATFEASVVTKLEEDYKDILRDRVAFKLMLGVEAMPGQSDWLDIGHCQRGVDSLLNGQQSTMENELNGIHHGHEEAALILLTSGTTSLPKACLHTAQNLKSQTQIYHKTRRMDSTSNVIASGPTFHILAIWNILMAWRAGASIVFPSMRFDVDALVNSLNSVPCTHMSCAPSMMLSLTSHPNFAPTGYPSLRVLAMGGDRISIDLLNRCRDVFRAQKVLNGWGMSEGIGILSSAFEQPGVWRDGALSIGHVMPGSSIRVCKQDTQEATTRGEIGELHVSGPSVVPGYLQKGDVVRNDSFYEHAGMQWFKTGDAVVMDDTGEIFLTGRYKDLIIRGGENVSPATIELCLNGHDRVKSSQVVGIDDPVMGQTPVAVLQPTDHPEDTAMLKTQVQSRVVHQLGPSFRLADVLLLSELGLEQFPTTTTGKVRKGALREIVCRLKTEKGQSSAQSSTLSKLVGIWQRVLGIGSESIQESTQVSRLADSLVILRVCFHIEQELDKRLTAKDLLEHETLAAQAALIDQAANSQSTSQPSGGSTDKSLHTPEIPPRADELVFSEQEMDKIEQCLAQLSLDSSRDVEAIYRPHDTMAVFVTHAARPASDNFRWVLRPRGDVTIEELRNALARCLANHANLRSIVVPLEDNTTTPASAHAVVKLSDAWLDGVIEQMPPVNHPDEFRGIVLDKSRPYAGAGNPSFRAQIIPVNGSQRPGVFISVYHAVFDAISMGGFIEELDTVLSNPSARQPAKIPYAVFADMYHLHSTSAQAQASKQYQQEKLKGIENMEKYLWPRLRGPGVMGGNDQGWKYSDGTLGRPEERVSLDEAAGRTRGRAVHREVHVPGLATMKVQHWIEASTLVKAAVAVFNVEQTGQDRAVFSNTEAGRVWPFMEPWTSQHLPNTMNIAGSCMGRAFNIISIAPDESAGKLLERMSAEQKENTKHCHAPWQSIASEMYDKGVMLRDVALRQFVNWDSSTQARSQSGYRFLERVARAATLDRGFMWNFGFVNPETLSAFISYDDVHVSGLEVEAALGRVLELLVWLADPSHWDDKLGCILGSERVQKS